MSPSGRARRVAQQAVGSVQPPGPRLRSRRGVLQVIEQVQQDDRVAVLAADLEIPSTGSRQLSSISRSASRSGRLATNRSTTVSPHGRRCYSANQSMAAAAGLWRVWYLTAIDCPAEPGAFVVQAGPHRYTAVTLWGNPRRHGVNEAKADRRRSPLTKDRLGGDDGQFLLRHLPGRTRQDHGRDPDGRCPARRARGLPRARTPVRSGIKFAGRPGRWTLPRSVTALPG